MNYNKIKKGISPVVATALLIVVCVLAVVGFQTWFGSYSSNIFTNTELKSNINSGTPNIEGLHDKVLYIKNPNNNLTIKAVRIDGEDCLIDGGTYTDSIIQITLPDSCYDNISTSTPSIVVVSDDFILEEKVFLKDIEIISGIGSDGFTPLRECCFVSVWDTSKIGVSNSTQIKLPLESDGLYNFFVDWGDGTNSTITQWDQTEVTHNYATAGIKTINISGTVKGFRFAGMGDRRKILNITEFGPLNLGNNSMYFYGCQYLQINAIDALDLRGTTDFTWMFVNAVNFNSNINNWDVSKVTTMNYMFGSAESFNQPLNNWDTSSVTNMGSMFADAWLFNQDISSWNTSKVTNMGSMFNTAIAFNQNISTWCVQNISLKPGSFDSFSGFAGQTAKQPKWGQVCP